MLTLRRQRHDCRGLRLDANETVFLSRQLEFIERTVYPVLYVDNSAFRLFPVSSEAGQAAKSITYRTMDRTGKAKIIASYADDLPKVATFRKEFPSPVRSVGASYGWSLQDIRSAMMAGVNLTGDEAEAAVRAHNDETNRIAWFGDAQYNLPGLKTNTDISSAAATTGNWDASTNDQKMTDIRNLLVSIISASKGVERANVVAMPAARLAQLTEPRSETSDTTILSLLQTTWPGVSFETAEELTDWDGGNDALLAFRRDPSKLTLHVPQPYEEMPIERHALRFEVATHSRVGGLVVRYPGSVAIRTGI